MGISVKLIIVIIELVIIGGKNCIILEKNGVINNIKSFEIIIEL